MVLTAQYILTYPNEICTCQNINGRSQCIKKEVSRGQDLGDKIHHRYYTYKNPPNHKARDKRQEETRSYKRIKSETAGVQHRVQDPVQDLVQDQDQVQDPKGEIQLQHQV